MTGISNVELLHEIKDRTRVLKKITYEMIYDTDINARLVSDALSDCCRSMCRMPLAGKCVGRVEAYIITVLHYIAQKNATDAFINTEISLSLDVCLHLFATSRLLSISPCLVAVTINAVSDGSLLQQLRRLLFLLMLDVIWMQASSMLVYGGICCTRYVCCILL
jgi:hypothetical protein